MPFSQEQLVCLSTGESSSYLSCVFAVCDFLAVAGAVLCLPLFVSDSYLSTTCLSICLFLSTGRDCKSGKGNTFFLTRQNVLLFVVPQQLAVC